MSTPWRLLILLVIGVAAVATVRDAAASSVNGCRSWVVVQRGDTLARIAWQHGTSVAALAAINHLPNPNLIDIGQRLCLALGTSPSPPPPSPPHNPPPAGGGAVSPREFCHATTYWSPSVWSWAIPPGCYAGIYYPNPRNYPYAPGWGWCNWWPEVLHPTWDIWTLPHHRTPKIGAAIYFAPGDQGASPIGHWGGEVIAITGGWVLISEMNDTWRGAGFGRVNYRYVYLDGGVSFVYP